MRLTFNMQFNQSLSGIVNAQQKMNKAETQLSRQTKILTPADDPAGAAKVLSLDQSKDQLNQFQTNSALLKNNLTLQETVLTSMRTTYDRVSALAIASGNGTYTIEQRKAVAFELQNIQTELLDLMNTRNSEGGFIFAGFQDKSPAYTRDLTSGEFQFKGDAGNKALQISPSIKLIANDSGQPIFENVFKRFRVETTLAPVNSEISITNQTQFDNFYLQSFDRLDPLNNEFSLQIDAGGNYEFLQNGASIAPPVLGTYTAGQAVTFNGIAFKFDNATPLPIQVDFELPKPEQTNVLNTLQNFIDTLNDPFVSDEQFKLAIADTLQEIQSTANNVDSTLANLGGRLNVLDSVFNTNEDLLIANQQYKADISEVDLAAALTEIKRQEFALQAASQTFSKVNATTLFDFIR